MPGVGQNPTKSELVEVLKQAQQAQGMGQAMNPGQQRPQLGKGMGQAMQADPRVFLGRR